jgi:hypothetical protein
MRDERTACLLALTSWGSLMSWGDNPRYMSRMPIVLFMAVAALLIAPETLVDLFRRRPRFDDFQRLANELNAKLDADRFDEIIP